MKIVGKAIVKYGKDIVKGTLVDCRMEDMATSNYGINYDNLVDDKFLLFLSNKLSGFDPAYITNLRNQLKYKYSYHIGNLFYKHNVTLLKEFSLLKVL